MTSLVHRHQWLEAGFTEFSHAIEMCLPGCGMCAVPFDGIDKDQLSKNQLRNIQSLIKQRIPKGVSALGVL